MKRNQLFILLLCMLVSVSAKSQFSKGDRVIGGAVNAYLYNNNYTYLFDPTVTNNGVGTTILPRYSWVSKNNVMNGIFLSGGYSHTQSRPPGQSDFTTNNNITAGIGYFRRNFKDFTAQFGWFIEYNVLIKYSRIQATYPAVNSQNNSDGRFITAALNIAPGLYFKVSPKVAIEAGFGGFSAAYNRTVGQPYKSNNFNVGLNFPSNFTFGLQFYCRSQTKQIVTPSTKIFIKKLLKQVVRILLFLF